SSDVAAIHAVHAGCFPTEGEARLVGLLREAGHLRVSLVAEVNHEIVGHIAFSPVMAADNFVGAGLGPLAVIAPQRRRGIGAALVRAGLQTCRAAGFGWVV